MAIFSRLIIFRLSLAVTVILPAVWFSRATASGGSAEVIVSQVLLLSLLSVLALVWNTPRLAEVALSFAGAGAILHAIRLHVPPGSSACNARACSRR